MSIDNPGLAYPRAEDAVEFARAPGVHTALDAHERLVLAGVPKPSISVLHLMIAFAEHTGVSYQRAKDWLEGNHASDVVRIALRLMETNGLPQRVAFDAALKKLPTPPDWLPGASKRGHQK